MIAIIDYGAGNLTSVKLAFDSLKTDSLITSSPADIISAERVVFPGVGAIGSAMQKLNDLKLVPVIRETVKNGIPFLGICLGTQIILEESEEDGGVKGIGLIKGRVRRFVPENQWDKIPQIGWNGIRIVRKHPVFSGIEDSSEFYFVHSYYPAPDSEKDVLATTGYAGVQFASVITSNNIVATQFHPEKSGRIGLKLLENFLSWDGKTAC